MNYYSYEEGQLLWAVNYQDIVRFRIAVRNGARDSQRFFLGPPTFRTGTLLEYCIQEHFFQGVEFLTSGRSFDMRLGLEAACNQRSEEIIDLLLQRSIDGRRNFSENLFVLLSHGKFEKAQLYVDNMRFDVNDSSLMIPAMYLKSNAGRAGQTPLHVAGLFEQTGIMDSLIGHGARVNQTDSEGYTALYLACARGNYDCARLLLRHGAKPSTASQNYTTQDSRSPLFAACHLASASEQNYNIVHLLLQAGLDLSQERWVANARRFVSDRFYNAILTARENTSQLRNLCIGAARDALSLATNGRTIQDNVETLPLPKVMKEELAFKSPEPSDDESD